MKIQDLLFITVLTGLWFLPVKHRFVCAGIVCLLVAIPLFSFWVFFTAQRLTWYAAAFLLFETLIQMNTLHKDHAL